ncbi:MAG: hypothetical protein IKQ46_14510 [Bacteroidales bacterium]|nr:hypothetical protein [Bacteroidales bacterium]
MQTSNKPLVSLCIPTNGIIEWVCPVLDSIFRQNINSEKYEVVVTDNGNNLDFEKIMSVYCEKHDNLVYKKTNAYMFQNQIEAFRLAKGDFIKFVNHRMTLNDGALKHIIDFVEINKDKRPVVYFLNGALPTKEPIVKCDSFEKFVENLSYWSSWSAGLAIWTDDFKKIPESQEFNLYFPHITVLFYERKRSEYIIDNIPLMKEVNIATNKKGKYNLFKVFAVEYVSIIGDLMRNEDISVRTFLKLKKAILRFVSDLYWDFVIRKKECSYILDDNRDYIRVYYNLRMVYRNIIESFFIKVKSKFF